MQVERLPSGKWRARYTDAQGRRRSITRPTKSAARLEAADAEAAVRAGTWTDPAAGRVTVADWYERWNAARVIEHSTRLSQATNWRLHVAPHWARTPLAGVSTMGVQAWVRRLEADGVGHDAVRKSYNLLSGLLKTAATDRLVARNPAVGVRLPTGPRRPFRILDDDEEAALRAALAEPYATLLLLTVDTGLRWAEVAGLHTHRLDLLRRRLHVVETLRRDGTVKPHPKSRAGSRTVPLSDRAVTALAAHLVGHGGGLVFVGPKGAHLSYTNFRTRVWSPALHRAGLAEPQPTFHDLRHTFASRLVEAGVDPETLRRVLGHESLTTTGRYTHTGGAADDRVRAALNTRGQNVGTDLAEQGDTQPACRDG